MNAHFRDGLHTGENLGEIALNMWAYNHVLEKNHPGAPRVSGGGGEKGYLVVLIYNERYM